MVDVKLASHCHKEKYDSSFLLLLFMVAVYPFVVIPGPLPFFYGPRYLLLIVVALSAAILLYQSGIKIKISLCMPMLIFFVSIIVASVTSDNKLVAWGGSDFSFTGSSTYMACGILLLIATQSNNRLQIIKVMVVAASIVSVIALLQHYGINLVPHEDYMANYHSYGTIGHPNYLGSYTVFILPASIVLFLHLRKTLWLLCSALIFGGLIVSMTRGAWLAFLVVYCYLFFYTYKTLSFRKRLWIVSLILISTFFLLSYTSSHILTDRASSIHSDIKNTAYATEEDYGNSISIRLIVWKNALKTFKNNWAFGIGPDNLRTEISPGHVVTHAFNFPLGIASTMGLFSLIAYTSIIYFSIKQNKSWVGTMLTFMIIAYLLQAQSNVEIVTNLPLFWIVLGLSWKKDEIIENVDRKNTHSPVGFTKYYSRPLVSIMLVGLLMFILIVAIIFYYPRTGTIEKEGQGLYSGQMIGLNTFHGCGVWIMENGAIYEGDLRYGLFHGYGILTYPNGGKYIGFFKDGYFHGEGKLILQNGLTQEGLWYLGDLIED